MARQLVVSWFGTIYDAVVSTKDPNFMTGNRRERTDEVIRAAAQHMKVKADENEEAPGFWQYRWPGKGTLTWRDEEEVDHE